MMRFLRQNLEIILVTIISLVIAFLFQFVYTSSGNTINLYERLAPLIISLLGLIIASYTIFVGFISQLGDKIGDKKVIPSLNIYFLFTIAVLMIVNIVNVILPLFSVSDFIVVRFLYVFFIGLICLLVLYTFFCAKAIVNTN